MKVSDRIAGLTGGGPDGWDIYRKSRRMVAQGIAVTELTIGEHDVRTDPSILEAMRASAAGGHTGYSALPGTDALRDAVAARLEERTGVPTARRNVVVTPGGQAALFAAHLVACDPGDRALFIDPYYATYPGTIRATGAIAVPVAAVPDRGFRPDRSAIEAALPARSILINSPNNPTGILYDRETLEDIGEVVRDNDLWIISDEVYDTQVWEGRHLSPRALPGLADRTLVIGSLSKSHAMTGSRLGWLAGPEEAIAHAINLTTHTTYGVPGFIQDAGLYALGRGEALEAEIAAPFRRRHALALRVLSAAGVSVVPSTASMYVMADIRSTGLSGDAFAERLLDAHAIAVMPGESFGRAAAGHVRIALTVPDDRLEAALAAFAAFHNSLKRDAA